MSRTLRIASVGLAAVALLITSACGSSSSSSTASSASALPSVTADTSLSGQVPSKYKSKGTLEVGMDASYAPNEFVAEDGRTIVGLDADIVDAVAARLGLKTERVNADFGTIILGVSSGKFDLGASSFTINTVREEQVNMVQYMKAGTAWAVVKGNPKKIDVNNICGQTVAVQKDTTQVDDLNARSKKCTDAGQPAITQVVEVQQSKATADLVSGKADAMVADSPVINYAIQQQGDQLERLGDMYDAAPYGLVINKADTDMANLVSKALVSLKDDGSYKAILDKWGNGSGSVDDFPVNPAVGG